MNGCLIVSTYAPRKCGIATFSKDLRDNLPIKDHKVLIAAISEAFSSHAYPAEVAFEVRQNRKADYISCANWVNQNPDIDMVILQHEYGIFGGQNGDYVLELASHLKKPYLLVSHTVLPEPSINQKKIFTRLADSAVGVICMTERARKLLQSVYDVSADKIFIVPHGVPHFTIKNRDHLKEKYGLAGRRIITTFGFISPGKGLEIGLKALAMVVNDHPEALYIIAGSTHPVLMREQGERYRNLITSMVTDLHLENNVLFVNRFLDVDELGDYLYMTDIYLSPYPNRDQAVSGPLSFAVGCGRAVISTPYEYAQEILADGRGLIASDITAEALAQHLKTILENPDIQTKLEKEAAKFGQHLTWESAGSRYIEIAEEVLTHDQAEPYLQDKKQPGLQASAADDR